MWCREVPSRETNLELHLHRVVREVDVENDFSTKASIKPIRDRYVNANKSCDIVKVP